ncbi:MAG: hypothetical protein ABUT20_65785, partial [Bacteroidota bacterium]
MIAIVLLLSSCYSSRKAKIDEAIKNTKTHQERELAAIKNIEQNKDERLDEGRIDSVIEKRINTNMRENRKRIDSAKAMMDELTASSIDRKTLRKSYRTIIKSKLVYLLNDGHEFDKRIVNYGMITDVLNNARQSQIDLATFFGPGEFMIPADKLQQATDAFMPVLDSVLVFAAKYPGINKNTTIVLKGYADAMGIKPYSPLYYRLVNEL